MMLAPHMLVYEEGKRIDLCPVRRIALAIATMSLERSTGNESEKQN